MRGLMKKTKRVQAKRLVANHATWQRGPRPALITASGVRTARYAPERVSTSIALNSMQIAMLEIPCGVFFSTDLLKYTQDNYPEELAGRLTATHSP